jgi:predicted small integral membrane protein
MTDNTKKVYLMQMVVTILASMLFLWTFSITIHDIVDPKVNLAFMAKVLAGGTPTSSLSIKDKLIIELLFYFMLTLEIIITLAFFLATIKTYYSLKSDKFNKKAMIIGLLLGLTKYFLGFVVVASEWFYMWQTSEGTQVKALLISILLIITLMITVTSE